MSQFIDIHTHQFSRNSLELKNCFPQEIKSSLLQYSDKFFSVGLHPWYIKDDYLLQLQELQTFAVDKLVLAIGEAGLDKVCDTPFQLQQEAFIKQIEISEAVQKPLIIHCVKAYNELVILKKDLQPKQPWIIHGFRGKKELADDLLRHGFYLSLGKGISHMREVVQNIPLEKLFLETDDSFESIEQIYRQIVFILEIPMEQLQLQLLENFMILFQKNNR